MRRGDAFRAERALPGRVGGDVEAPEGFDGNVEVRAARSVDQHGGPHDLAARRPHRVDRFLHRAARRHDVVDHGHALAGSKSEAPAELATGAVLAALRIDRPNAELPRDLVRQDDPSGGRSGHSFGIEQPCPRRERGTEALRLRWVLKHLELFEIQT